LSYTRLSRTPFTVRIWQFGRNLETRRT